MDASLFLAVANAMRSDMAKQNLPVASRQVTQRGRPPLKSSLRDANKKVTSVKYPPAKRVDSDDASEDSSMSGDGVASDTVTDNFTGDSVAVFVAAAPTERIKGKKRKSFDMHGAHNGSAGIMYAPISIAIHCNLFHYVFFPGCIYLFLL